MRYDLCSPDADIAQDVLVEFFESDPGSAARQARRACHGALTPAIDAMARRLTAVRRHTEFLLRTWALRSSFRCMMDRSVEPCNAGERPSAGNNNETCKPLNSRTTHAVQISRNRSFCGVDLFIAAPLVLLLHKAENETQRAA